MCLNKNISQTFHEMQLKPDVVLNLKSLTIGNFLCEETHPFYSESIALDAYIFDLIVNTPDHADVFEIYEAETGECLPVCEAFESFSAKNLKETIKDHYSNLESNFLRLVELQLNNTSAI